MSPEAEQRVRALEEQVAQLKRTVETLTANKTSKGAQEFIDNDVVILRNLYAEKLYTKRSGTYVELTT